MPAMSSRSLGPPSPGKAAMRSAPWGSYVKVTLSPANTVVLDAGLVILGALGVRFDQIDRARPMVLTSPMGTSLVAVGGSSAAASLTSDGTSANQYVVLAGRGSEIRSVPGLLRLPAVRRELLSRAR